MKIVSLFSLIVLLAAAVQSTAVMSSGVIEGRSCTTHEDCTYLRCLPSPAPEVVGPDLPETAQCVAGRCSCQYSIAL